MCAVHNRQARRHRRQACGRPQPAGCSRVTLELPPGATTTSTYARFIGRIGALAVALGVGAAVATNYGVPLAHADETEQGPAEQPTGEQPGDEQPGDGGGDNDGDAGGADAHDPPTVTINGDPVDGKEGGGTPGGRGPGGGTTVPEMNFSANGGYQEDNHGADKDKGKAKDADAKQPEPLSPPEPPVDPGPPVDVVPVEPQPPAEPQPPVVPDPPADPKPPAEPKPPVDDVITPPKDNGTNVPVVQQDPPSNGTTPVDLDAGKARIADKDGPVGGSALNVDTLTVQDNGGTEQGASSRIATFNAAEPQNFSTQLAPEPNIIEPEQPNLIAGLVSIPGIVVRLAATVLAAALAPFVTITGPIAPPQPPTLWAVLAWVRREFQRTLFNHTPQAVGDSAITDEDESVTFTPLTNDSDFDEDPLTVTDFTQPDNGTVTYDATTKTFTYTPDENFHGTDTFEYAVEDQGGLPHWHGILGGLFNVGHQASTTVTVTVNSVDDPLQASDDEVTTDEDTPVTGNVLDNDLDDDPLTVATPGQTIGEYGVLNLKADGSYTYSPGGVITLNDPDTVTQGTVDYDWTGDDPGSTRNYLATTFTAGASGTYEFSQPDGDTDTVIAVYQGAFNPADPSSSLIDFNDDELPGETLKPSLTVDLAAGQTYTVVVTTYDAGEALDPGLTLQATVEGDPANALTDGDEVTDTFGYTVTNGTETDTASLVVTVTGVDDPLQAVDDVNITDEDTPVDGNVLANDTDPDDGPLTVTTPGRVIGAYGVLDLNADGSYTYTPGGELTFDDPAQVTQGTIDYDWTGDNPGTTRNYVATTFTAGADGTYEFGQNADSDTLIAVYEGDFDPASPTTNLVGYNDDADFPSDLRPKLTVDLVAGQQYTVVVSTYTPEEPLDLPQSVYARIAGDPADALTDGDEVTDTFEYTVTNGTDTATAELTVYVDGVNDGPQAVDDFDGTDEDTPIEGNVLGNDTDPEGDPLTVTSTDPIVGQYGILTVNADGSYTYTPGGTYAFEADDVTTGTVNHSWIAGSPSGTRNYVAVVFTADASGTYVFGQPANGVDTTMAIYHGTFDDTAPETGLLASNDDDGPDFSPEVAAELVEGEEYTIVISTFSINTPVDPAQSIYTTAPGTFSGSPVSTADALNENAQVTDTFTYTVTDGNTVSSASVSIGVTGVDDAPFVVADTNSTDEDTAVTGNVLTNDVDPEGNPLTVNAINTNIGKYGILTIHSDGSYTYTPGGTYNLDADDLTTGTVDHVWVAQQESGERNYVATVFTADATGTYQFGQHPNGVDTVMAVYQGSFDPDDPTTGLLAANDDSSGGLAPRVTVALAAGQTYTIVITTFDVGEPLATTQNIYTTAPGSFAGNPTSTADALAEGETVTDTFLYGTTDGTTTKTTTLTVTVTGVNDAPAVVADIGDTDEDTAFSGDVLANDIDPDGDPLTVTSTGTQVGQYGILTVNADGSYTYTPGGIYVFDADDVTTGTVNHAWIAGSPSGTRNYVATQFTADATGSYVFGQPDNGVDTTMALYHGAFDPADPTANLVTANDDSGPGLSPEVTANLVAGEQYTVVISTWGVNAPLSAAQSVYNTAPGTFGATPSTADALTAGQVVTDTFTYTITDGTTNTGSTVTITVTGVNDAPKAVADTIATDEDTAVSDNVLTNDVDLEGNPLHVAVINTNVGQYGVLTIFGNGNFTYTPGRVFVLDDPAGVTQGTVDHVWVAQQESGERNYVATVFTANGTGTYLFGQPSNGVDTVMAIYQGAFDPDDPAANLIIANDDSGGGQAPRLSASLVAGQEYTIVVTTFDVDAPLSLPQTVYTTAPGTFAGNPTSTADALAEGETVTDTFVYRNGDGASFSNPATITVTIIGTNDAPVITAVDPGELDAAGLIHGSVTATDVDGDALTYGAPTDTTYGSVSIDPDSGEFIYTPDDPVALSTIPGTDFESGDFTGWNRGMQSGTPSSVLDLTSNGVYVADGALTFDPVPNTNAPAGVVLSDWVFTPDGNHAAVLSPNGQQTFVQATSALGLTAAQQQAITTLSNAPANPGGPTDAAWISTTVHLEAGTIYTMSWNYVSTDYEPWNDGSITTLVYRGTDGATPTIHVNGYQNNYAILGYTNAGTGDYSTKSFASTGWQTSTYQVSQTGDYQLGFAVFNIRDDQYDPVLLVDSGPGTTTRDGQDYSPVSPNSPTAPRTVDDTFTVTVDDGNGGTDSTPVTVQVTIIGAQQV